jgi:hypothetical protein
VSTRQSPNPAAAAQLIAAVVLGSTAFYAVIGVALTQMGISVGSIEPDVVPIFGAVFCVIGISLALSSLAIRRALLAKSAGTLTDKLRVTIICMAIAESSGVLGLVFALLSGTLAAPFILWGASLAVGILHFPSRGWLEEGLASDDRRGD